MSKEHLLSMIRKSGVSEGIVASLKKNTEEELEAFLEQFGKKKKGPKTDIYSADDVISKLKTKPLQIGDKVSFDLFLGKGGSESAGKVTGHVVSYRVYAVVEYENARKGKTERKELDAFKL